MPSILDNVRNKLAEARATAPTNTPAPQHAEQERTAVAHAIREHAAAHGARPEALDDIAAALAPSMTVAGGRVVPRQGAAEPAAVVGAYLETRPHLALSPAERYARMTPHERAASIRDQLRGIAVKGAK